MALLVVGAYAGWTFVAVKSAGIVALRDDSLARTDPALIWRFVGGEVTRMPFDVVIFASLFVPAILLSVQGGWRVTIAAHITQSTRWWNRASRLALAGAFLCAVMALQLSFQLLGASVAYSAVAAGANQDAVSVAKTALDAVHLSAERSYLALALLAALSTLCGAVFLTRRASIFSRMGTS